MTVLARSRRNSRRDMDRERRPPRITLLREIKGDTPVHRTWAGTKLLCVAGLSVTLSYFPSWGTLGIFAALLALVALLARVPRGAWPRPPIWFWMVLVLGGALTGASGGSPYAHVTGLRLGFGGVDSYVRFVGVGVELILAAALVGWTTPLAEIAPAVSRLLAPLRLVRVPVDEWAVAVALCVRSLPLLVSEVRTLAAARKLRPRAERPGIPLWQAHLEELVDLLAAGLAVSMRRAGELAEAITARGGTGLVAAKTRRPALRDLVALVVVVGSCVGAGLMPGA